MCVRFALALVCLVLLSNAAFAAEPIRITVIDFTVQSDNPAYKYLGKGFAEFTVIELAKTRDVMIIDRVKRNETLQELSFAISDLADEANQMRVGRLLAAQYLISGSIFELAGRLIVTIQVLDIEKGAVVFTDKASGDPGAYDFITASLAGKILTYFRLRTPEAIIARVETPVERPAEAAVHFSNGVDAIDRQDTATARTELTQAQTLDPASDAIRIYLSKLVVNTSKFKLMREPYYPDTNPAYLGIIQYDRFSFDGAGVPNFYYFGLIDDFWKQGASDGTYTAWEGEARFGLSYQLPIGKNFGSCIEISLSILPEYIKNNTTSVEMHAGCFNYLGILSFGWAPIDFFSVGLGISLYYQTRNYGSIDPQNPLQYFRQAFSLGFLLKNPDSTVIYDFMAGYALDYISHIDVTTGNFSDVQAPMFLENTFTLALADRTVFLIFKQLNDIAFDRQYYFGRLLGALEWWLADWFSFHVSAEGSLGLLEGNTRFGYGGNAGVTFRIPGTGRDGWDFSVGISYRLRPSRVLGTILMPEFIPVLTVSKTGSFVSR